MLVKTTVLREVAMVMLNITIWSGAKKLEPNDFINVDVQDLPSSRVASFGIKHLIDKERLAPFKTLRGQADRLCARYGTRFLGGYAIPQDCIDVIGQELKEICAKFEQEIDNFMVEYDTACEEWIRSNSEFSEPLRRAMLPRSTVRSRFKASFSIFEVSSSPLDRTQSMASSGNELFDSVLQSVVVALKPYLDSKSGRVDDTYRVEVRQTITDLSQKIRRFSFMDPDGGMMALAAELESAVSGTGKIKGAEFSHLWGIINQLQDLDAVKDAIRVRAGTVPQLPAAPKLDLEPPPAASIVPIFDDMGFQPNPNAGYGGTNGSIATTEAGDAALTFDSSFDLQDVPVGAAQDAAPLAVPQTPDTAPSFNAVFDW